MSCRGLHHLRVLVAVVAFVVLRHQWVGAFGVRSPLMPIHCETASMAHAENRERIRLLSERDNVEQQWPSYKSIATQIFAVTETDSGAEAEGNDGSDVVPSSTGEQILALAVPALGALLIDPLMTLADTAFVGRFSETADELAGMGSAAALLTFSFYLFNFFCTATTPLVASRRAAGQEKKAIAVGGQALSLSLGMGAALAAFLWAFQQQLLAVMGVSDSANTFAVSFLTIRALAAPAVLCISASTGILRGYLDTKTPIYILIATNLVNLALDVALIAFAGQGPLGAAIATTTAEWTSALLFLGVLAGKLPSADGQLGSNRAREDGKLVSVLPSASIPTLQDVKPLLVASSSVFLRSLVLQLSLSAAAAMAARDPTAGPGGIAAHQVALQLWLLCSFICDALAAASQALVADAIGREDLRAVQKVSKVVLAYSLGLGAFLALGLGLGSATHFWLDFFTRDETTQVALSSILGLLTFSQPLNAFVFAADGVLQGASEFPFQAKAMALSGATAVGSFLILQNVLMTDGSTLVHVWTALIILQTMRGLTSAWKMVQDPGPIQLLSRKEAEDERI